MNSRIAIAVIGMILLAGPATAGGILSTPPHAFADVTMICLIGNVGSKDVAGHIEILGPGGAVLSDTPFTATPGQRVFGSATDGTTCRFHIDTGSKKSVRATAHIVESTSGESYFLPAS